MKSSPIEVIEGEKKLVQRKINKFLVRIIKEAKEEGVEMFAVGQCPVTGVLLYFQHIDKTSKYIAVDIAKGAFKKALKKIKDGAKVKQILKDLDERFSLN